MSVEESEIRLRPVLPEDLPRIRRWMVAPHVARWLKDAPERVADEIERQVLVGEPVVLIATMDGRPIGGARIYDAATDARWAGVPDISRHTKAIEFLIGEPSLVNKKVGRRLARAIAAHIFADPTVDRIVADPHPDNWAAIIAMKRAGFRDRGRHPGKGVQAMFVTMARSTFKS